MYGFFQQEDTNNFEVDSVDGETIYFKPYKEYQAGAVERLLRSRIEKYQITPGNRVGE